MQGLHPVFPIQPTPVSFNKSFPAQAEWAPCACLVVTINFILKRSMARSNCDGGVCPKRYPCSKKKYLARGGKGQLTIRLCRSMNILASLFHITLGMV